MAEIVYNSVQNLKHGFYGLRAEGQGNANSAAIIVVSSKVQDDLLPLTDQVVFTNADLTGHAYATYDALQTNLKSTTLWQKLLPLDPLIVYITESGWSSYAIIKGALYQGQDWNCYSATSLRVQISARAQANGVAKSFACFGFSGSVTQRPLMTGAWDQGAFTGTLSDYNGNGDHKMADVNVSVGNTYDMNRWTITPSGVLTYAG